MNKHVKSVIAFVVSFIALCYVGAIGEQWVVSLGKDVHLPLTRPLYPDTVREMREGVVTEGPQPIPGSPFAVIRVSNGNHAADPHGFGAIVMAGSGLHVGSQVTLFPVDVLGSRSSGYRFQLLATPK